MTVTINNLEYHIKETMPGVIQFVTLDAKGHVASTLEATTEVVYNEYGPAISAAVRNYLESFDHLCQLAVDYGYVITHLTTGEARLVRTTRKGRKVHTEFIAIYKFSQVFWKHWTFGGPEDVQGYNSASLWKLLNLQTQPITRQA